jgi:hypothetical protein
LVPETPQPRTLLLGFAHDFRDFRVTRIGGSLGRSPASPSMRSRKPQLVPVVDELRERVPEIYIALKPGLIPSKPIEDKKI